MVGDGEVEAVDTECLRESLAMCCPWLDYVRFWSRLLECVDKEWDC